MNGMQIIFLIVSAVILFSAVMVVTVRRMMHAALWLVMVLLGVGILFAMLQASFFAVIQILVYVGAIAILIIFAVMLTRRIMEDYGPQVNKRWWIPGTAVVVLFGLLASFLSSWDKFNTALTELPASAENIDELGKALVAPLGFVIPFEVASVLLLAALVGALYVAIDRKGGAA